MKNNIENKIKKEFKNREIKPSNNAWEVLNAQLEVTTTKKENKKLKFLAYAAVFIGLLFGLIAFINGNKTTVDKPVVVDRDNKIETPNNNNQITNKSQNSTKKVIETKNEIVATKEPVKVKNIKKQIKNSKKKVIFNVQKNSQVASNDIIKEEKQEIISKQNIFKNSQKQITKTELSNINSNANNESNNKPKTVKKKLFSSDEDIDLLLATALKSDTNKTIKNIKIQTAYLQYSVESEINTPIGNKILKTLKAGVDTVEEYITSNN